MDLDIKWTAETARYLLGANLLISVLIYLPFVRAYDRRLAAKEAASTPSA